MTVIDTTPGIAATGNASQRKIAVTSTGTKWVAFYNGTGTEFWYSNDDGSTWTQNTSATITSGTFASLFIDVDDHAHVAYATGSSVAYSRMASIGPSTSWSSPVGVGTTSAYPDVVVHREGSGWVAHIVYSVAANSTSQASHMPFTITSGGTITAGSATPLFASAPGGATDSYPSIDFHHTGNGKTVQGSTPHLYVAFSNQTGADVLFRKATYSAGSWTWGTVRTLDATNGAESALISSYFDGTRFVVAYVPSTSTSVVNVRERDAADTATTTRTPTALSDGVVTGLSTAYDVDGDIHLIAVGTTSDDVKHLEYDRSAGTWGSWTTVATSDATADSVSAKRGYSNNSIEVLYTDGTGTPWNVVWAEAASLNSAPTAATWFTSAGARDVTADLLLAWTFNDPDPGDTQGAYAVSRTISAVTTYWNAAGSSWDVSEVKNTSSSAFVTVSSWASDGDAVTFKVKTWDAADVEGTYSSGLNITASTKVNPEIATPAQSGTVTTSMLTMVWTCSEQTAYKAELLTDADVQLATSGWVTSTATSYGFSYTMTNATTYRAKVTTRNADGLESDADTHGFDTAFTPPSTPTLVVSESPTGALNVAITNPGAGATESYNDVFVRIAAGGTADESIPVGGDGVRVETNVAVGGSFTYYAPASGKSYQFLVRAHATNMTSADSSWSS